MKISDAIKTSGAQQNTSGESQKNERSQYTSINNEKLLVDYVDVESEIAAKKMAEKKKSRKKKNDSNTPAFETFQMKLYAGEREKLDELVKAANTNKTAFVKQRVFSNEKIIIFNHAANVSRSLIEISDQLRCSNRNGSLSNELLKKIFAKLCDIANDFTRISKELTVFQDSSEDEGDSDVDS